MSATGVNLNWSSVMFNSTAYSKITQGSFDHGTNVIVFGGDTNIYPTVAAVGMNNPSASFTLADVGAAEGLTSGATGVLTAQLNDAKGATGGAVVFTAANAIVSGDQSSGSHAQFASATLNFLLISSDGTTNPVVITRA